MEFLETIKKAMKQGFVYDEYKKKIIIDGFLVEYIHHEASINFYFGVKCVLRDSYFTL